MLPNFLCIGTQRSGSTWLYNCLKEHPEVFLPEVKEVSFFDAHYKKGISYYSAFFEGAENFKAVGDITPGYIYCESCPARIARYAPDIKMIAVLRNPIERAYSAYTFFMKHNVARSFDEMITSDFSDLDESVQFMLQLGIYHTQLERYFSCFKREQFLILQYEDVVQNNSWALSEIYGFLGVATDLRSSWIDKTVNVNVYPKVQQVLSNLHMEWLITSVKRTPLGSYLRRRYKKTRPGSAKEEIGPEIRQRLIEYYQEPNRKLEQLIGKDLSSWNE